MKDYRYIRENFEEERERKSNKANTLVALILGAAIIVSSVVLAFDYGEKRRGTYSQILPKKESKNNSGCLINTLTENHNYTTSE